MIRYQFSWDWGSKTFNKISNNIVRFLEYTNNGTNFVFGFLATPPNICDSLNPSVPISGAFAFTVSLLLYFSPLTSNLISFSHRVLSTNFFSIGVKSKPNFYNSSGLSVKLKSFLKFLKFLRVSLS